MNDIRKQWLYLVILSLTWGSSFILIKKSLIGLTPIQVGTLRISIAAFFLLIIGFKRFKEIKRRHVLYLILSAFLGTFIPAIFFAISINEIDSSIASILNALTPLGTLLLGLIFFKTTFRKRQFLGVTIGLLGTLFLITSFGTKLPNSSSIKSISLVLFATLGYAANINIIKKYLSDLSSLSITVAGFVILLPFSIPILIYHTPSFNDIVFDKTLSTSLVYVSILAIFGYGLAILMFNQLIKFSSPIFSSSVTYFMPIVAVTLGMLDGEKIAPIQLLSGFIILMGIYLINRK